jgi:hypothetical protein
MKAIIVAILLSVFSLSVSAEYVRGHYRRDGTYVQPHQKTPKDNSRLNNYSTKGNINPYTGKKGYRDPYDYGTYKGKRR